MIEPGLRLRLRVERLAELHDVDAALTERRARPAGSDSPAPPGICSLTSATTFFAMRLVVLLGLLDLHEVELDRRRAAEDADQHAQLALVGLHFLDDAVEVLERAVDRP